MYHIELALNGGDYKKAKRFFVTVELAKEWVAKAHKGRAYRIMASNELIFEAKGRADCLSRL